MALILVSIVSMNDGPWLRHCLNSLAVVTTPMDVVVVANACDDDTDRICHEAPIDLTIIRTEKRLGFAGCNNICLEKALEQGHDYVFLLNADTRVNSETIESLLGFMEAHRDFGIAGSLQMEYGDDSWSRRNEWSRVTLEQAAKLKRSECDGNFTWIEHSYVQGAALMFRLDLVRRIGLLDPVYHTFYEETDLCRRCWLAGQKVAIVFDSKVQHYGGGNWKASVTSHRERDKCFLRNQFLYYMSGANSFPAMSVAAARVVLRHLKALWSGGEDVILPAWQYVFVLWSAALRIRDIVRLYQRNAMIRSGAFVPECLWRIGQE